MPPWNISPAIGLSAATAALAITSPKTSGTHFGG
jgi:hypothetical protein